MVLQRHFGTQRSGFYVEVGSHDPHRFSNTYLFYRRGWRGICIDALPGSAKAFRLFRPRDTAVEIGVARLPGLLSYYMFNEPALNTFDPALVESRTCLPQYRLAEVRQIATKPLAQILDEHMPGPIEIDFMSVDAEGLDLEVLQSNDWKRFRPKVVVAECLSFDLPSVAAEPLPRFLMQIDYRFYAKTGNSVIFVDAGDRRA